MFRVNVSVIKKNQVQFFLLIILKTTFVEYLFLSVFYKVKKPRSIRGYKTSYPL